MRRIIGSTMLAIAFAVFFGMAVQDAGFVGALVIFGSALALTALVAIGVYLVSE